MIGLEAAIAAAKVELADGYWVDYRNTKRMIGKYEIVECIFHFSFFTSAFFFFISIYSLILFIYQNLMLTEIPE